MPHRSTAFVAGALSAFHGNDITCTTDHDPVTCTRLLTDFGSDDPVRLNHSAAISRRIMRDGRCAIVLASSKQRIA
jgi:hypothetical protein